MATCSFPAPTAVKRRVGEHGASSPSRFGRPRTGNNQALIEIRVAPDATQLRIARRAVRSQVGAYFDAEHVAAIEAVANELLGVAFDGDIHGDLVLTVETFTLLTSVRVHCPSNVQLRDEPFGLRERVLEGFAFAWGKRIHGDGSVDLWAELARRRP